MSYYYYFLRYNDKTNFSPSLKSDVLYIFVVFFKLKSIRNYGIFSKSILSSPPPSPKKKVSKILHYSLGFANNVYCTWKKIVYHYFFILDKKKYGVGKFW